MISRRLPTDPYNRCITFLYGTVPEINAALKRRFKEARELQPSCKGHWTCIATDGHEQDFICVVRGGRRDWRLSILAHETIHMICHALRMAGLPMTEETEEAYTYYHQWVFIRCARYIP